MIRALIFPITVALAFTLPCKAVVVDFNNIPDGTLVSANNPYAGILDIQASAGPSWFVLDHELEPGGQGIAWMESTIFDGYLQVVPSSTPPPGTLLGEPFRSRIMATFSQPVTNVSFDAFTYREAVYRYNVVDANGVTSNEIGGVTQDLGPPFKFDTFNLNVPEGGYLTRFELTNMDDASYIDAAIWIDNIRFDLAVSPVPDAGGTGTLLAGSCIVLGGLCFLKQRGQSRARL